jgi:hypothetical protein
VRAGEIAREPSGYEYTRRIRGGLAGLFKERDLAGFGCVQRRGPFYIEIGISKEFTANEPGYLTCLHCGII